jgi:hypothetical protein
LPGCQIKRIADQRRTRIERRIHHNFSLFFGIAVQLYEATLVSDDTPCDRFRRQHAGSNDPNLNPWTNLTPSHIRLFLCNQLGGPLVTADICTWI